MSNETPAFFALVIVLVLLICFFLASPTFLLVRLHIPEATRLLRGLFSAYFIIASFAAAVATAVFAVTAKPALALGIALIAAFSMGVRARLMTIPRNA